MSEETKDAVTVSPIDNSVMLHPVKVEPEEQILKFFAYKHLPEKLQIISKLFYDVAYEIYSQIPRSAERTVALRKLLEGKDAAVRAALEEPKK